MRLTTFAPLLVLSIACFANAAEQTQHKSVLDFTVKDIDGKDVDLTRYKGNVLLMVNVASRCGYTPQYQGLESIYRKYKEKGFVVLAFPANEFGGQEPGTESEIKQFCTSKYDVSFDLFSKIIAKGDGQHPLFRFLTSKETDPEFAGDIKWNFTKFLISRDGKIVRRFEPKDKPEDPAMIEAIEAELAKAAPSKE